MQCEIFLCVNIPRVNKGLTLEYTKKVFTDGLIDYLRTALQEIGISDVLSKNSVLDMAGNGEPELVCSGTDGASVNIGKG